MVNTLKRQAVSSAAVLLLAMGLSLGGSTLGFAQKTAVYTAENKTYLEALELFDKERYATAQKRFQEVLQELDSKREKKNDLFRADATYYLARCAIELQQPDGERLLLHFAQNYPESPKTRVAWFQLGRYYYQHKEYKEAITWFEQVDVLDLTNQEIVEYRFKLGFSYFYKKNFNEAKPLFESIRNIKGEYYYPTNYYYAFISFYAKDYDAALNSFLNIQESKSYGTYIPYYVCQIYFLQKRYDKLIDAGVKALDHPNIKYFEEISYLVGQAYYNKGEFDRCIPYLNDYVNDARNVRKEDIYQLAYAQYKTQIYDRAINNFNQLVEYDDSLAQNALYNMADCYLRTGNKELARNAFVSAAKYEFDQDVQQEALFNRAKLSFELGFHRDAIQSFSEFMEKYPNSRHFTESQELLSEVFLYTRDYEQALRVFETFKVKTPRIQKAYQKVAYNRAVDLYNTDTKRAHDLFNISLKYAVDPNIQAACHFWKGEMYYSEKKFAKAIDQHRQFLGMYSLTKGLGPTVSPAASNYTMGYCYFSQEDYNNAILYFKKAGQYKAGNVQADALLRTADAYFLMHSYDQASEFYGKVMKAGMTGQDYAYYQKGIIEGLSKQPQEKIKTLTVIKQKFPGSIYYDDALYEIANTHLLLHEYDPATENFKLILDNQDAGQYTAKAMVKLGLIHYNLDKLPQAKEYYKRVYENYAQTNEGREALLGLREVYIALNDPSGYIDYLGNSNISKSFQDSIMYLAAENQFNQGNYDAAILSFSKYLTSFPNGFFAEPAHYYKGESLYEKKEYANALPDYAAVIKNKRSIYMENSLLKASEIAFMVTKNNQEAFEYYQELLRVASFKENRMIARRGVMRTAFALNNHGVAREQANQIIASNTYTQKDKLEAHYYLGKASFAANNLVDARKHFKAAAVASSSEKSVESRYHLALIQYKEAKYDSAKNACFQLINSAGSYEIWVVRSFILLSDIYVATDELFQAKVTLQSILENYEGSDQQVLVTCRKKLDLILESEAKKSKLKIKPVKKDTSVLELDTFGTEIKPGNDLMDNENYPDDN